MTLTGALGTESAAFSNLFSSPATFWRFGLALVQPILNLKSIEGNVAAATARRDAVTVQYQQTVQNAFREVHDALVTNTSAQEVLAAETRRRDLLVQALDVANLRYEAGRTSYLEVLDAQRTLLAVRDAADPGGARRAHLDRRFREIAGRGLDAGEVRRRVLTDRRIAARGPARGTHVDDASRERAGA